MWLFEIHQCLLGSCRSTQIFSSFFIFHLSRYLFVHHWLWEFGDLAHCFSWPSKSNDLVYVARFPGVHHSSKFKIRFSHVIQICLASSLKCCGYYHVLGKSTWFLTVLCVISYSMKLRSVLSGRCLFSLRKNCTFWSHTSVTCMFCRVLLGVVNTLTYLTMSCVVAYQETFFSSFELLLCSEKLILYGTLSQMRLRSFFALPAWLSFHVFFSAI